MLRTGRGRRGRDWRLWLVLVVASVWWSPLPASGELSTLTTDNNVAEGDDGAYVAVGTKVGQVRGRVGAHGERAVTRFLGVPYAQAPVGELRFSAPRRHPGWVREDYWDATTRRALCPHDTYPWRAAPGVSHPQVDEDCLHVSLYVPVDLSLTPHVSTLGLAVMVYLHDGAFGAEPPTLYDMTSLALQGNVIVVMVSYRIGVLGFLGVPNNGTEGYQGNYGLLDQRMAIHWVWDNVREFGGDPGKVTIFGQGSGGAAVAYHMLSPLSKGVFSGAISQGAYCVTTCALAAEPHRAASMLAGTADCDSADYGAVLTCLRRLPLAKLLQGAQRVRRQGAPTAGHWMPVVDGHFLPAHPARLLKEGRVNSAAFIVGVRHHSANADHSFRAWAGEDSPGGALSEEEFNARLYAAARDIVPDSSAFVSRVAALEYMNCGSNSGARRHQAYTDLLQDIHQVAPLDLMARTLSTNPDGHPVYFYVFQDGNGSRGEAGRRETDLLLGGPPPNTHTDFLHTTLVNAWTNFAKTRDPNPVNDRGAAWRPYDANRKFYLLLDRWVNSNALKEAYRHRQMAFWNEYVRSLEGAAGGCARGDFCGSRVEALQTQQQSSSVITYVLGGICGVLMLLACMLGLMLCHARNLIRTQPRNKKPKPSSRRASIVRENGNGNIYSTSERTKLNQPLPYIDEKV